ncbi:hypothetical protein PGH07_07700 [Sulfurovum sp. zt1-1]|uniref:Uncharacterized protein n=1 Tax=Sulfurovum zhangzhouensis TaxID=3019067 RepID=A0ABT7QZ00_9BACT|nr:hypothetical protein [Sulfurovum zhangzhouensis]MDM5272060.1 hypothetical protein [Sulfurovum zhangzhouensis]
MNAIVLKAMEVANQCYYEHHQSLEELNNIYGPTEKEIEVWLEVRERFYEAQEKFEGLIQ